LLERLEDRITPAPLPTAPEILSTSVSARTVNIVFSEALDPSTVNLNNIFVLRQGSAAAWPPTTSNLSSYVDLNSDPRALISYDPSTSTVTLNYSNLSQTEMPSDSYAIVVLSQNSAGPGVTDTAGDSLDGLFNGSFPSGQNGQPATFIQDLGFNQLTAPQITTFSMAPSSDLGIPNDQITGISQPVFVGQLSAAFPGSISGDTVEIEFSGLHNGITTLAPGGGGRGFTGTFDKQVSSNSAGIFMVTALPLPEGSQDVVAVVIGPPDQPPLPGLSSASTDAFLITPVPTVTLPPPTTALIGDVVPLSVTFANTGDFTGFGPFVDIELPTAGNVPASSNGLSFISGSATYLGQSVDTQVLTFDVSGHVTHPFASDPSGSGQPLVVTGTPGDELVVFTLPLDSFTPGQPSATIDFSAQVSSLATLAVPLPVSATGGFQFGADPEDNPIADPPTFSSPATDTVTPTLFIAQADLVLVKQVSPTQQLLGFNVTYTFILHNTGPDPATNVVVTDPFPAGLTIVGPNTPSQGTFDPATGIWDVGTLPSGATATLTVTARILVLGSLTNTASATGDQFDPALSNNTDAAGVTGMRPPGLVSKRFFLSGAANDLPVGGTSSAPSSASLSLQTPSTLANALATNTTSTASGGSITPFASTVASTTPGNDPPVNDSPPSAPSSSISPGSNSDDASDPTTEGPQQQSPIDSVVPPMLSDAVFESFSAPPLPTDTFPGNIPADAWEFLDLEEEANLRIHVPSRQPDAAELWMPERWHSSSSLPAEAWGVVALLGWPAFIGLLSGENETRRDFQSAIWKSRAGLMVPPFRAIE
jgi:uncharacterized repeat protein (TIGR01451 family)